MSKFHLTNIKILVETKHRYFYQMKLGRRKKTDVFMAVQQKIIKNIYKIFNFQKIYDATKAVLHYFITRCRNCISNDGNLEHDVGGMNKSAHTHAHTHRANKKCTFSLSPKSSISEACVKGQTIHFTGYKLFCI